MQQIKTVLEGVVNTYPQLRTIVQTIHAAGGQALLVGGAVRDLLLGIPVKDLDIEVHALALNELEGLLAKFGPVSLVGKSFGVFRLHGLDIDWSLPRTDSSGRKPQVTINPHMTIEDAFRRRDLTINAMGIDLITQELVDPFGGEVDLKKKLLRSPDINFFAQDPLRFFRVMQFIGRFDMQPDQELEHVCRTMVLRDVSRERIETEFEKLLLKSQRPSLGIRWLRHIDRLQEIFPEVWVTIGLKQNPTWHPEGDVFEHTMQTLDAAARISCDSNQEKLILMYAALCHDLGKVHATQYGDGKISNRGHARKGMPLAKKLLKHITRNKELVESVVKLVGYHMIPLEFAQENVGPAAYKRLASNLAPHTTIAMLAKLSCADRQGRNGKGHEPLMTIDPDVESFLHHAQVAHVFVAAEEPVLHGRDLLAEVEPGPVMGKLLKKAYQIQLEESITDKDELKRRVLKINKRQG